MSAAQVHTLIIDVAPDKLAAAKAAADPYVEEATIHRLFIGELEIKVSGMRLVNKPADVSELWLKGTAEQLYCAGVAMGRAGVFPVPSAPKPLGNTKRRGKR